MGVAKQHEQRGFEEFSKGNAILGHYRYGQAAAIYKNLMDLGYDEAGYELGKLVCVGWGVQKNSELAREYWHRANLDAFQRERLLQVIDFRKCLDVTKPLSL